MRKPSLLKTTTQLTLGILASATAFSTTPAEAASFSTNGTFSSGPYASFSATWSGDPLPTTPGLSNVSSWNIDLKNAAGQSLFNFSNAKTGASVFAQLTPAIFGPSAYAFDFTQLSPVNAPFNDRFRLGFTPEGQFSFGEVELSVGPSQGVNYRVASATAVNPTGSTPIPTPALLPGLVGMGFATLRKRNAATVAATEEG